ncbi:hypothetical protein Tco_0960330 [Tanacetum coccineum]
MPTSGQGLSAATIEQLITQRVAEPLNFKGTEGVVWLTRRFKKMENVFHISNCPKKYQVKYASCTLQDSALTWWNSHKRTTGTNAAYAMTWKELMKLMTEGSDHGRDSDQQQSKRIEVVRAHATGVGNKKANAGNLPYCNKCKWHHIGPCNVKCGNCKRVGHMTKNCRTSAPATIKRTPVANQKPAVTYFGCGAQRHFKSKRPILKNRINMPTSGQSLNAAAIEKLITQRVTKAMAAYEANQNNQNGNGNPNVNVGGVVPVSHECTDIANITRKEPKIGQKRTRDGTSTQEPNVYQLWSTKLKTVHKLLKALKSLNTPWNWMAALSIQAGNSS